MAVFFGFEEIRTRESERGSVASAAGGGCSEHKRVTKQEGSGGRHCVHARDDYVLSVQAAQPRENLSFSAK